MIHLLCLDFCVYGFGGPFYTHICECKCCILGIVKHMFICTCVFGHRYIHSDIELSLCAKWHELIVQLSFETEFLFLPLKRHLSAKWRKENSERIKLDVNEVTVVLREGEATEVTSDMFKVCAKAPFGS